MDNGKNLEASTVLFYVDSPPISRPVAATVRSRHESTAQRPIESSFATKTPGNAANSPIAESIAIDWESLKDSAVREAISREEKHTNSSNFRLPERAGLPLPQASEHDDFPWDRNQGKRAGFTDEGLPYVSLSKKCAVVLFFLVCGFGGEIKPERELFSKLAEKKDKIRQRELP